MVAILHWCIPSALNLFCVSYVFYHVGISAETPAEGAETPLHKPCTHNPPGADAPVPQLPRQDWADGLLDEPAATDLQLDDQSVGLESLCGLDNSLPGLGNAPGVIC